MTVSGFNFSLYSPCKRINELECRQPPCVTTFLVSTVTQARVTQMLPACYAGGIAGLWPERLRRRLGTVKMYSISMTQQRLPFKIWIESLQYKTLVYKLGSLQENDLQCCSRKCVSIN